jgi:hypothetical protein
LPDGVGDAVVRAYDEAEEDEVAQHSVDVVRVIVAHVLIEHAAQLPQIPGERRGG